MSTDLTTLGVLQNLDGTLTEVRRRADGIGETQDAFAVLLLTQELAEIADNLGALPATGADLGALRVLAAGVAGDRTEQFRAASLAATLSLATGDPEGLASARDLMRTAADLAAGEAAEEPEIPAPGTDDRDPASTLDALLRTVTEKVPHAASVTVLDARTGQASTVNTDTTPEVTGSDTTGPATDQLRMHPLDPAGDDAWATEIAALTGLADEDPGRAAARAGELHDIILAAGPEAGSVRPVVLRRLFELHRISQRDPSGEVAADRARFLDTMNSLVPGDLSATAPVDDRILLNRYRADAEDASPERRLAAAQKLVNLHAERDDRAEMAKALLTVGEQLEKLRRMAEMYDTYQRALGLAVDAGAIDTRIWATIRLAFAQYIAGDKMTATQMLLDQDAEITPDQLTGVNEAAAMAEAKVALANLFGEAGDTDGRNYFLDQAVDLFEGVGQAETAARYRDQLS